MVVKIQNKELLGEGKELRVEAMYNDINKTIYIHFRIWFQSESGAWQTDTFGGGKSVTLEKLARKNTKRVELINKVLSVTSQDALLNCYLGDINDIKQYVAFRCNSITKGE